MIGIHHWFGSILFQKRLIFIESRFNKYGPWVILIGRQLFGIRAQVLLMAGIMRLSFLRYLLSDTVAALVTMDIMITAGYTGGKVLTLALHKGEVEHAEKAHKFGKY